MPTETPDWLTLLNQHSDALITWLLPSILILLAVFRSLPALKRGLAEFRIKHCIRKLGHGSLHKIVVPDGLDGFVYIENLVLGDNSLYVLPVQRYRGVVFAADNIDTWTQVVGKRSYKFNNPMRQLDSDIQALKSNLPNIKVDGRVLFTKGVEFPKGKPDNVVSLQDISNMLNIDKSTPVSSPLQQAWEQLNEISSAAEMQEIKEQLFESNSTRRDGSVWWSLLLAGMAAAWLVWRLNYS